MGPGIDKDGFDRKIETTYKNLEALLQRMSSSGEEASIANEALEELSTTLEELHVASDEMSRQNIELAAAHLAAQAERQRYQDLFDFAPDGYLVTDTNGVIREANRAAADLLHVTQERLVGKPLAVYVAEAERKAFRDILSTLLKRAITGANEWEIGLKSRAGKELRASITVTPVVPLSVPQVPVGKETTDGVGLRWSLRDITESKRAEERERLLKESRKATQEALQANRLLQTVLDTMPVGVTICDPDGTIRKINLTGQEMLGGPVTGNARKPERNFELLYPDGRPVPPDETLMIRALEGKEVVENVELLIRRADGSELTILGSTAPVLDAAGQVVSGVTVFRDISEHKQAEETLRKSEADLRGILNATNESVWMFDPDGTILMGNKTALRRFSHSAEEVIGQPFHKFMPADLAQARQVYLQKVVETGEPVESEDKRAGIIFHHTFYPVKDSAGSVVRIAAFSQDITERKQAEEQIRILARFPSENPNPVMRVSTGGVLLYANQASQPLLKEWQAAIGQPLPEFWQTILAGLKDEKKQVDVATSEKVFSFMVSPVSETGYINLYGRDITERKQAEERLTFQANILANIADVVYTTDKQMRVTYWNPAAEQLFGWKANEVLGRNVIEVVDSNFEADRRAILSRELTEKGAVVAEVEHRTKSGQVVFFDSKTILLRDNQGETTGFLSVNHDITGRKQAEKELIESEERYRKLVQYAPAAIYEMDLQGTQFLSVNDVLCGILKYSREELLSTKPIDLLDQKSQEFFKERIRKKLSGEQINESVEYRIRRKDGEWIDTVVNVGSITYKDDMPNRVVVIGYDITERKKIEQALRESEEKYRSLVKFAPAGIYEVDFRTGRFTEVNDVMCQILGYTREELLGMTAANILDDEGTALFAARIRLAQRGDQPTPATEYRVRTKDGRLIWALLNITFHREGGKIVGATVIANDITERRQAEQALQESEARFRSVLDNSRDVIYRLNLQTGKYVYISPSAEKVMGFSAEELMAQDVKTALAMIHPDDLPRVLAAHARLEQEGESDVEYRQLNKSGEYRWLSNHLALTRDSAEQPQYRNGNLNDITEHKQAEEALNRQAEMLDLSYEAIFSWELNGTILSWNKGAEQLYGFSGDEAIGQVSHQLLRTVHPEKIDTIKTILTRDLTWTGELEHITKDGSKIVVESRHQLFRNETGRQIVLETNRNITERKQAEEKLRASNDELRRFNKAMVGRELRMVELKNEINELCRHAGLPERYSKNDRPQTGDGEVVK